MTERRRPRVLYVVYWGALEPLGQSLVLPAVTRLAEGGAAVTLMTFEKAADLANREQMSATRALLAKHAIEWRPLRYHKGSQLPAKAYDALQAWASGLALALKGRYDVLHARTFIGGLIGRAMAPIVGARFVYHNEGFYPDEQVDGGVWAAESRVHRLARTLERGLYERADAIIALSHAAEAVIRRIPGVAQRHTPIIVVPSCVNLERFQPASADPHQGVNLIYIGSVGLRYLFDRVVAFASAMNRECPVHLRVLAHVHRERAEAILRQSDLPATSWSVDSVPHERVAGELARQDAGIFFLTRGLSEHGCSPTKIGEYWACGLPVVTTANVGDVDAVVRRDSVGVVVEDHSMEAYRRTAQELVALLRTPDIRARCRRAAQEHYSLDAACERQLALYRSLVSSRVLAR